MVQSLTRQEPRVLSHISSVPGAGRLKRAGGTFHGGAPGGRGDAGTGRGGRELRQCTRTALQPQRQHGRLRHGTASPAKEKNPRKPNQHRSHQALLVSAHGAGI